MADEQSVLREENEHLRKEVDALLQAKEIAKEKVRSAIQELVDENKKLKKKITTLEAQVASLLAERNSLRQRLGEGGIEIKSNGHTNGHDDEDIPRARSITDLEPERGTLKKSISQPSNISSPIQARVQSADDVLGRATRSASDLPAMSASGKNSPVRRNPSKAAALFGISETKVLAEMEKVPEALTVEEEGLLMMRTETDMLDIKGGHLDKLVERLYHTATATQAPDYVQAFFLTFRAFAPIVDVATLLMDAYAKGENKEARERILRVFMQWLDAQPEDFQTLGELWDQFLTDKVGPADGRSWVKLLQQAAKSPASRVAPPIFEDAVVPKNGASASPRVLSKKEKIPKPIVPKSKSFTLDEIDAKELSRQLTLIDYELFQKIRPSELNNLSWTKKSKDVDAPNLLHMIHRFNQVSLWVQYVIVSGDSARRRALNYEKFVKVGYHFKKDRNYNGVMQIVSAMAGAAIHRLAKTHEKVSPKIKRKFNELHDLMSAAASYKVYRESLQEKEPPCIPYLGVHLTDLTALNETQKNTLAPKYPDYLNFSKHFAVANLIKNIIRYQSSSYALYQVPIIREWVLSQIEMYGHSTEEKLFETSLVAEPREE